MKILTIPIILTISAIISTSFTSPNIHDNQIATKSNIAPQVSAMNTTALRKTQFSESIPKARPIPFKDGTIIEAHSLDYANRSYHKITSRSVIADIASKLDEYTPAVSKDENSVGFLIVTDKGKYEYYLPSNEKTASAKDKPLITTAKNCNKKYPGSAQWLAFMSTSNITAVTYSGSRDRNLSLKNPVKGVSDDYTQLTTTDTAEIQVISAFLKGLSVESKPTIRNTFPNIQTNNSNAFSMEIEFKSGTIYYFFGGLGRINISTTINGKAESIGYDCTENQTKAMFDMFSNLNSAIFNSDLTNESKGFYSNYNN